MSGRRGILAGGNWIVDKLKFVDTYPQQDTLANILSETFGNGGGPFNVLVDLARLGAPFPLEGIGLIGADTDGEWILEQCAASGIETGQLARHEKAPTSYTDVMTVQATGRRTFFHQRGANAFLGSGHFDFGASRARIFHLGYLLLLDLLDREDSRFGTVAAEVLHRAGEAGFKTSVDVVSEDSQRFATIVLPALRYVDYCILNEFEIGRTTGIETRPGGMIDRDAIRRASEILLAKGVREWVIVHFPEGACALGKDGSWIGQGSVLVPQADIVSSVGAGDAFAAGVLYALHEENSIETALRYGVTAAASCLYGVGTSTSIEQVSACLKRGEAMGFRDSV